MVARKPKAEEVEPEIEMTEVPVPPEGYRWVLIRGDHCPAQHCPVHLDDPIAYSKT